MLLVLQALQMLLVQVLNLLEGRQEFLGAFGVTSLAPLRIDQSLLLLDDSVSAANVTHGHLDFGFVVSHGFTSLKKMNLAGC
jgi:hypothetical protein